MIEPTRPTPLPDASMESRGQITSAARFLLSWRVFGGGVAFGLVCAVATLALGILALKLLSTAESIGLLPRQMLSNALQVVGIRWGPFTLSAISVLFYGGFSFGLWIVVRRMAGATWASFGGRAAPLWAYLLVSSIYIAIVICSAIALSIEATLFFHGHVSQINNPKNNAQQAVLSVATHPSVAEFLLLFFSLAVVGPVVEEVVFRGMLFQLLRRQLPLWAAVTLSAVIFAVLHAIPILLPTLFIFGVALALVFHYTRSLYCSMFLHMLINTIAVIEITRP